MTAFDKKVNQIAARHRWNIEKQARAAVPCYIIAAPTYEDAGKIVPLLPRFSRFHGITAHGISPRQVVQRQRLALFCHTFPHGL